MASNSAAGNSGSPMVEQWASKVLSFSSQYNNSSWAADCILGSPRVYPKYGDIHGAWAHRSSHANNEFIEVEFPEEVFIEKVDIYETYNAGAIVQISVKAPNGTWHDLYKLNTPPTTITHSRIFTPDIQKHNFKSKVLKIILNCSAAGDWCELDSVRISGHKLHVAPPPPLSELTKDLSDLVNSKLFSDITFEVEGETIHGHKAILASRASYFRAMFCDGLKESHHDNVIKIEDVGYEAFLNVMQYLYTNDIKSDISPIALTELTRVADRFSMDGLFRLCNYKLCNTIDSPNVVCIYRQATESLPVLEDISRSCLDFISYNMSEVSQQKDFAELPQNVMLEIIQQATSRLSLK